MLGSLSILRSTTTAEAEKAGARLQRCRTHGRMPRVLATANRVSQVSKQRPAFAQKHRCLRIEAEGPGSNLRNVSGRTWLSTIASRKGTLFYALAQTCTRAGERTEDAGDRAARTSLAGGFSTFGNIAKIKSSAVNAVLTERMKHIPPNPNTSRKFVPTMGPRAVAAAYLAIPRWELAKKQAEGTYDEVIRS